MTNAVQVHFQDRTSTSKIEVEYRAPASTERVLPGAGEEDDGQPEHEDATDEGGARFERIVDPQTFDRMAVPDTPSSSPRRPRPSSSRPSGGADAWDERAARGMSAAALLADDGAEDDDPPAMLEAPGGNSRGRMTRRG